MPKKAKAKTKIAKRKVSRPKNYKKPSTKGKRKGKAGLTLGIGVISTIRVPTPLRTAFKSGLNNPNVVIKVEHALSYNRNKLKAKILQFNADETIGLILTVGGLVAYQAAALFATKPFLSLVGDAPVNPAALCYGGVSMQSYRSNPDRVTYLGGKGFAPAQIGLIQNPNSAMATAEKAAWTGARPTLTAGVNANGDNDPTTYPNDFANIPANLTAIVLSADPFFQDTKDDLVAAANSANRYMCYPLQDYAAAAPAPTHLKATAYGPALADPYTLMGERAGSVLTSGAKLVPLFSAVLDTVTPL